MVIKVLRWLKGDMKARQASGSAAAVKSTAHLDVLSSKPLAGRTLFGRLAVFVLWGKSSSSKHSAGSCFGSYSPQAVLKQACTETGML